ACGFPRVVRRARPVLGRVLLDARVPPDLLRALRVVEEIRIVALLPDEDQVRRGHEVGDEIAAVRRTRERIRPDAEPAGVVVSAVVRPERLDLDQLSTALFHPPQATRQKLAGSGTLGPGSG